MAKYIKNNVINNGKYLYTDTVQIFNPTAADFHANGWMDYVQPELTLEEAKAIKIAAIQEYDISTAVNSFFLNNIEKWLSPSERVNYKSTLLDMIEAEISDVNFEGVIVSCSLALNAIKQLNIYAAMTVAVTNTHISNVSSLNTIEEITNYDFTLNYPAKITINI